MAAVLLKFLMIAALVGSVSALGALGLGLSGSEILSRWHSVALISCGVVSIVGLSILTLSAQRRIPGRDRKKLFVSGCPRWMRWLTTCLSLIGLGSWFWLGLRHYQPPAGGVPSLMAGAFALFICPAVFGSAFSYLRRREALNRRCSKGHDVPLDARFCPLCGETLEPVA